MDLFYIKEVKFLKKLIELQDKIESIVKDKNTLEQIINSIAGFQSYGNLTFTDDVLNGKKDNEEGTDFLEVRVNNGGVFCFFTLGAGHETTTIEYIPLSNGNYRMRNITIIGYCKGDYADRLKVEKEIVFNSDGVELYKEETRHTHGYDYFDSELQYDPHEINHNLFCINKTWFIQDGYQLRYLLEQFLISSESLVESYSLCYEPEVGSNVENREEDGMIRLEIDKGTFALLLSGELTPEQVREEIVKLKLKKNGI